jgi:lipoprotein NlpI
MKPTLAGIVALVLTAVICRQLPLHAAEPESLLTAAVDAARDGEMDKAIKLVGEAIKADPKSSKGYALRARLLVDQRDYEPALADFDRLIELSPEEAEHYYYRGRARFCTGKIAESIRDFDHYVEERPRLASRQWERGIAIYYAGKFGEGAKQFELYQTYHDNDVENATWRFLCMARDVGVEQARAELLPIENDRRVPMMQIYALYRGKGTADEVLKAAQASDDEAALNHRLFYAHLYLGLYYEALGKPDLARRHILESEKHKIGHYMWDVAHVHAERLRAAP